MAWPDEAISPSTNSLALCYVCVGKLISFKLISYEEGIALCKILESGKRLQENFSDA